jgi:hypothetical protein
VGRASAPVVVATTAIVAVTGAPALAATVTRVPVDAGTAGGIGGVDAVSTKDGWAVGSTGTDAVIRRFDGTRWRVVPSPSLADPSAPSGGTGLSAVDAVDTASANTAFAVGTRFGNGNAAVAVRWNGSAWSRSTVGRTTFTNSRLVAVKAFSATDAWAVGSQASTTTDHTLAMHFDGTSWTEVPVPSPGTRNSFLTSVSGVAPNDVWAVGYIQNLPYGNRIRLPTAPALGRHHLDAGRRPGGAGPDERVRLRRGGRVGVRRVGGRLDVVGHRQRVRGPLERQCVELRAGTGDVLADGRGGALLVRRLGGRIRSGGPVGGRPLERRWVDGHHDHRDRRTGPAVAERDRGARRELPRGRWARSPTRTPASSRRSRSA